MIPPVPHAIQRGRGRRHPPLGYSGGAKRGWIGGTGPVVRGIGGIFLFQQRPRRVDPTIEAKEGIRLPHWPLRPGRLKDEHKENGQNGMPAMPCAWSDVLGSVREVGYGDGTNLPGTAVEEGGLPRVRGGGCSGIAADAPSESILRGAGGTGRGTTPPYNQGGPNLPGLFTETSVEAPVPGGGVPMRGLKSKQPTASLCTPPRAGHNSDPGGGKPTVPQVNLV